MCLTFAQHPVVSRLTFESDFKQSLLVSNEVIRSRAPIVAENIQKWGNLNTVVTNNDPKDFQRLGLSLTSLLLMRLAPAKDFS
jgi:hypothetical protein